MKALAPSIRRLTPPALWYATLVIIVGLPFHVLIYSLLFAHLPHLAGPFRDWKEALIVLMSGATVLLMAVQPQLRRTLLSRWETRLIISFTILNAIFALGTHDRSAAILAVKVNVVFLWLFVAACAGALARSPGTRQRAICWCLVVPSAIVGLFGLAQLWLLPLNFLTHFGYGSGPNQIQPYELLTAQIVRVQSILFGPNQFGSYLILPLILVGWLGWQQQVWWRRLVLGGLWVVLVIALYGTQSRGSWLGFLAGGVSLIWLVSSRRPRVVLSAILALLVIASVILAPTLSHSRLGSELRQGTVNRVETHGSSDPQHLARLEAGWERLLHHPWGEGLTVVGRASDVVGQSFYTENFYLQIGDQVGIEGLVLFVAILILVGWRLVRSFDQPLARPLLAALIGISVMNLFAQTWSDGATALLWWGAAGAIIGVGRLSNEERQRVASV